MKDTFREKIQGIMAQRANLDRKDIMLKDPTKEIDVESTEKSRRTIFHDILDSVVLPPEDKIEYRLT
jgi:hypothetical protein